MQTTLPFPHTPDYSAAAWLQTQGTMEALATLENLPATAQVLQAVVLAGPPASGKTHLLHMFAQRHGAPLNPPSPAELPPATPLVVDDIDILPPAAQTALFHAYNRRKSAGGVILAASGNTPANLPQGYLPDLKSRLSAALVVTLALPSEDERRRLLLKWAAERQLALPPPVLAYLATHATRNVAGLHALVARLDTLSLAQQRPLTVPLLKQLLATGG